jgi:hypothetical protein
MKMDNLTILDRHYDARADGWRVLARLKGKASTGSFAVGWQPRDPALTGELHDIRRYLDQASAKRHYTRMNREAVPPLPALMTDWQQEKVYNWEGDLCYPYKKTVARSGALKLIRTVCRDYGIEPPTLVMRRKTDSSAYLEDSHEIQFGHRDTIGLLHELAHALCDADIDDDHDYAHHNPAFVWKLIELYHRYAGLDLSYLTISASVRGLTGDFTADQAIPISDKAERIERKRRGPAPC